MIAFEVLVLKHNDTHKDIQTSQPGKTHLFFFQQGFRLKLLSISLKWRRNCWHTETVQYSWGHFHPWREKGYWRPTESLHLSNSDSLPSRPRQRRKFFSFEKLFLFTDGLLRFLPSKFSFWSTTTHIRTYKQANLAKLTCSFSTKLQAETFAHFADMKKKLLADRNCSVLWLLGTFSPLRW